MYENTILKDIENVQTIYIAGHINPDGDAVGSCFGFALAMAKLGKTPVIFLEEYPEKFNVLKGSEYVYKGDSPLVEPKIFFALDCGDPERLGKAKDIFERAEITYNIDHHISNTYFARYNIVNGGASSASEVVYELLSKMVDIDKDIASAIYAGILTDTGGFRHSSTSERTHEIAGKLVSIGVNTPLIHSKFLHEHTFTEAMVSAIAIGRMKLEDGIAYTYLTKDDMDRVGARSKDREGIVSYLLNTEGVDLALFAVEKENGIVKLSFRSNKIDVNEVAALFGGGGHKLASGAALKGELDDILQRALDELRKRVKNGK